MRFFCRSLSVIFPAPTSWTQAARAAPWRVEADGSYGAAVEGLPVMGFMAQQHPEGFTPGEDFEAIGYEPPPPGSFHQHWLRAPEGRRVTVVITSCGRLPGLRRTVHTLLASNTYPIDQYLIVDDSGNMDFAAKLIEEFGDVFDILVNRQRMGQLFSIDKAYSVVTSEYIFHCEDDWVFNGIPHLIRDSLSILNHDPWAFTVHVSNTSFLYPVDAFEEETQDGVKYHKILNVPPDAKNAGNQKKNSKVSI